MLIKKKCLICKKEFVTQSSRIKSGRGKYCSRSCTNVYRKTQLKDKNPCWRGGRIMLNGYWWLYAPQHPFVSRNHRYVQEHRLVMEKALGRYLNKGEIIHHINHIKTDNRPENLTLMSKEEHHKHHSGGINNPMYGAVRDRGLGKLKVKMPFTELTKYKLPDSDWVEFPFTVVQSYLNNDRNYPLPPTAYIIRTV